MLRFGIHLRQRVLEEAEWSSAIRDENFTRFAACTI